MDSLNAGMFDFYASMPWTRPLVIIALSVVIYVIVEDVLDRLWPVVRRTPPETIVRNIGVGAIAVVALGVLSIAMALLAELFWIVTGIGL